MRYTTSTVVGTLLGTTFSGSTDPTQAEVVTIASFVSELINQATGRIWTTATTSEYLDVWDAERQSNYGGRSNFNTEDTFFLSRYPVTAITFVRENQSDLGSSPSWVTRATGAGGDVLLYGKEGSIRFHKSYPYAGHQRLWVSYTYGVETTPDDIAYAAACLTAAEILTAIKRATDSDGLSAFSAGDISYTFGELENQRKRWLEKADRILQMRGFTAKMAIQ